MTAAEGEGGGGRVLFVRLGSFSHVNASLLAALRRARPDLVFEDFDLRAAMPGNSLAFRKCVLGGIAEYGPGSLRSRSRLRFCVMRSAAYFNTARRLILQRAAKADYAFTVQTQTLFNAATGRCPNLIYTDHASRAREASGWDEGLGEPSARWLALESGIYRDASHVFTFGSRVRGVLVDRYGMSPDRVSCAGTGANVRCESGPDFGLDRYRRRSILFAGIEWERKGGPDLLAAFRLLRRRMPDARLTIVGCTPPEAEGVENCVSVGRVTIAELARHYEAASCLCVPSRHEPFGNVFVEAGHFGLPVVATRIGEIADVVHDGVNGYRVPVCDPAALAEALWQVLHDPEQARRMGQAGQGLTRDYNWDTVAARILRQTRGGEAA